VLIDPGHSPKSPGATSCNGKSEYIFNDILAKAIVTYLTDKNIQVTLSRKANEEVSLINRALAANGRNLLLSIHHDSVQPSYISHQSGKRGRCSQRAKGFSIFVSRKNQYYEQSLLYATKLGAALLKRGAVPSMHHAEPIPGENRLLVVPDMGIYVFDDLAVLKNAKVSALLLEAGVIVNPDDELLVSTNNYHLIIAESVYEMLSIPLQEKK